MKAETDHIIIDNYAGPPRNKSISLIISEISSSEPSLFYRSKTETLRLLRRKNIVLAFSKTKLVGFLLKVNLSRNWSELTTLYVCPEYRGQGIARQLIALGIQNSKDKNLIMLTKNPAAVKILRDFGFVEIKYNDVSLRAKLGMLIDVSKNMKRLRELIIGLPEESQVKMMLKRIGSY